jgi:hypothetical protein
LAPKTACNFYYPTGRGSLLLAFSWFRARNVSINNAGFNRRLNRWQLFDFNQSRPIEVAAIYCYPGGTRGFRSANYEDTGLFTPKDDFISLLLTAKHAFYKLTAVQEAYDAFFQPFSALFSRDTKSIDLFKQEIEFLK